MAAVVEDVARPIGMKSAPRIGVLEQVRTVELAEAMRVGRKVRRYPIEDHADPRAMQLVDHRHEIIRRAVSRRRREEPGHLIAPRSVERMLHHGHQLDVREPELRAMPRELCTEIAIAEHLVVIAPPRSEVDFVDADRRAPRGARAARPHPLRVAPLVLCVPHHRRGGRRMLGARREWIRLVEHAPIGGGDRVLVASAVADVRERRGPDSARLDRLKWIRAGAPAVPIPDHRDPVRVRCPHGEVRSVRHHVRAQLVVEPEMRALVEQEQIVGGQHRRAEYQSPPALTTYATHRTRCR